MLNVLIMRVNPRTVTLACSLSELPDESSPGVRRRRRPAAVHLQQARPSTGQRPRLLEGPERQHCAGHPRQGPRPLDPERRVQRSSGLEGGAVQ